MSAVKISRREMLRGMGLFAAGTVLAACAPAPAAPEKPAEGIKPTEAPPKVEKEVVLEVGAENPEYANAERQIWDIFEAENPGIKIKLFSVNEDTAAAFRAKVAGGYMPAFSWSYHFVTGDVNKDNYLNFVDLSTIGFPWFDRWTYDVKNAWADLYGLPGPRTLNIYAGFVFTWMYHADLMEQAGLNPREDIKTWDDLKKFLEEGTAWAKATPEVDHFWDQGWHNWVFGANYVDIIPLAFPDGQQDRQRDCWTGKAKFNAPDSPFRHTFEFFKEAYDKGWIPENFWTREWETDMEASYIAKKSVMMLHGPWPWDKMLAADPTAKQLGLPATPPAEGMEKWVQFMGPIPIASGICMLEGVQKLPEWEQIKTAFFWWHSPKAVKMRGEALGRPVTYKLDEPLELTGPQWVGIVKDIATPGGLWEDVEYTTGIWGEVAAAPHRKGGSPGVWDWESGAFVRQWADLMTGKKTVQDVLDWAQANWEQSYATPA